MPGSRRFPPPWTVEEYRGIAYIVRDANRFAVAYVYFALELGHTRYLMTKDEAENDRGDHRKAARAVWTTGSSERRWSRPLRIGRDHLARALGGRLTPPLSLSLAAEAGKPSPTMSQKGGPSFAGRSDRGSITAPRSTLLVSCTIRWAAETTRKARWRGWCLYHRLRRHQLRPRRSIRWRRSFQRWRSILKTRCSIRSPRGSGRWVSCRKSQPFLQPI